MGTMEVFENLLEGQVIMFSIKPEGKETKVRINCQFIADTKSLEAIQPLIVEKILEIEKIIKEAARCG